MRIISIENVKNLRLLIQFQDTSYCRKISTETAASASKPRGLKIDLHLLH